MSRRTADDSPIAMPPPIKIDHSPLPYSEPPNGSIFSVFRNTRGRRLVEHSCTACVRPRRDRNDLPLVLLNLAMSSESSAPALTSIESANLREFGGSPVRPI